MNRQCLTSRRYEHTFLSWYLDRMWQNLGWGNPQHTGHLPNGDRHNRNCKYFGYYLIKTNSNTNVFLASQNKNPGCYCIEIPPQQLHCHICMCCDGWSACNRHRLARSCCGMFCTCLRYATSRLRPQPVHRDHNGRRSACNHQLNAKTWRDGVTVPSKMVTFEFIFCLIITWCFFILRKSTLKMESGFTMRTNISARAQISLIHCTDIQWILDLLLDVCFVPVWGVPLSQLHLSSLALCTQLPLLRV